MGNHQYCIKEMKRHEDDSSWFSKKINKIGRKVGKGVFKTKKEFYNGYKLSLKQKGWKEIKEEKNEAEIFIRKDKVKVITEVKGAKEEEIEIEKRNSNLYIYAPSPQKDHIKKVKLPTEVKEEINFSLKKGILIISLNQHQNK